MESHTLFSETICAPCTPIGGAIVIIRVAGPQAIGIAEKVFRPVSGKPISTMKSHTLAFGSVRDSQGQIIDEAVASIFRAPHSYTGEDIIELSCHGSSYIAKRVMDLLLECGCRAAEPGEFTKRAYLNGKMDLCQAEAVADLISSSSAAAHRMAMHQMRGGVSNELKLLREKLLHLTTLMELELDFSDHEDLEFANRGDLTALTQHIISKVTELEQSFRLGNALKNGIPIAIIGETNVGKSTILNLLAREQKAIVSNIHGTTRDVIEDTINIKGVPLRLTDTAGIRESTDIVESMGIQKTYEKLHNSEVILWVIDLANMHNTDSILEKLTIEHSDKRVIILLNKSDLLAKGGDLERSITDYELIRKVSAILPPKILNLKYPKLVLSASALNANNITNFSDSNASDFSDDIHDNRLAIIHTLSDLEDYIVQSIEIETAPAETTIITNARHHQSLRAAHESLTRVINGICMGTPTEFISQDLRETISHLGDITGQDITTEDILSSVFSKFCVGK